MDEEEYIEDFNYKDYNENNNHIGQLNSNNNKYFFNNNSNQIYIENNNYYQNNNFNQYDDAINSSNIDNFSNKNTINKINQIYNLLNLYDNISLYNHKNENEKSNIRINNIINLLLYIFSGFNIKLKETPNFNNIFSDQANLENNINKLNLILKYLNSKFLIKNNISSEEYILLTIYYIDYFDFFKNILDFLKNKQNDTLFSWKNLYLSLNDNM